MNAPKGAIKSAKLQTPKNREFCRQQNFHLQQSNIIFYVHIMNDDGIFVMKNYFNKYLVINKDVYIFDIRNIINFRIVKYEKMSTTRK